jgi:hypothetical protein
MLLQTLVPTLRQKLAEVESEYMSQTGGQNACRLQKDGRVTGGVKYEEGRLITLSQAKRLLSDNTTEVDFRKSIEKLLEEWQEELILLEQKEQPPVHWVAYRQGGVDGLQYVLELINRE